MNKERAKEWVETEISEICELIVDCVNKTAPKVKTPTKYKMLRTTNIKNGKINTNGCFFVTKETYLKWTRRATVDKGDVLLTREAPMGEVGFVNFDEKTFLGQRIMQYRANQRMITPEFLYYSFLSPFLHKQIMRFNNGGSTVSHIRVPDCSKFIFRIPELSLQKQISKVLFDIDKRIELNNKINSELEAMAKLIYDYWFVQFDFPDENGKPYKSSGGKMVWNDELKREIPEGWKVKALGESAEVIKGELITEKNAIPGNIKVIAAGIDYSYFHNKPNRQPFTITVSGSGANAGIINFWRKSIFASDCITVRGERDIDTILIRQYLFHLQDHIYRQAKGSAQPHVYPYDVKVLPYVVPDEYIIQLIKDKFISVNNMIAKNEQEISSLIRLRDELLPMLMNGQVTVGASE